MSVELSLAVELERRAQVLPAEVARWRALTGSNVNGLGIHRSQMEAITVMLETLLARQLAAVDSLDEFADKPEFPLRRVAVERELSVGHGIMAIFQHILAQRQAGMPHREALDAADLIAADCYQHCIGIARGWQVLDPARFREPPLTYLNAAPSPTAATRRHLLGVFGQPGEGIAELPLPVSVLSLPFDYTLAIWTYCALYHEVGHPVDQDLGLAEALEPKVRQRVSPQRWPQWRTWLREMVADVFGVVLGGVAYGRSLASLLVRPADDVVRLDSTDVHPNAYVRIFLVAEMLRQLSAPLPKLAQGAAELEQLWQARYEETPELAPYRAESAAVVEALLDSRLDALKGHALREFGASMAADDAATLTLEGWLRTGFQRPEPNGFPYRLVPAAAESALLASATALVSTYADIHDRAGQFLQKIPRPEFLANTAQLSESRKQFFRDLTNRIRVELPGEG